MCAQVGIKIDSTGGLCIEEELFGQVFSEFSFHPNEVPDQDEANWFGMTRLRCCIILCIEFE